MRISLTPSEARELALKFKTKVSMSVAAYFVAMFKTAGQCQDPTSPVILNYLYEALDYVAENSRIPVGNEQRQAQMWTLFTDARYFTLNGMGTVLVLSPEIMIIDVVDRPEAELTSLRENLVASWDRIQDSLRRTEAAVTADSVDRALSESSLADQPPESLSSLPEPAQTPDPSPTDVQESSQTSETEEDSHSPPLSESPQP